MMEFLLSKPVSLQWDSATNPFIFVEGESELTREVAARLVQVGLLEGHVSMYFDFHTELFTPNQVLKSLQDFYPMVTSGDDKLSFLVAIAGLELIDPQKAVEIVDLLKDSVTAARFSGVGFYTALVNLPRYCKFYLPDYPTAVVTTSDSGDTEIAWGDSE